MKFITLSAAIATASAALGDDCYYDASICAPDGLECATWEDSQYGPMASCEDCNKDNKKISDSFGDEVEYVCPAKEGGGGGSTPTPAPPAGGNEDSSSSIIVSAFAVIAATAIYAWTPDIILIHFNR